MAVERCVMVCDNCTQREVFEDEMEALADGWIIVQTYDHVREDMAEACYCDTDCLADGIE